jgi:hypothetical protein
MTTFWPASSLPTDRQTQSRSIVEIMECSHRQTDRQTDTSTAYSQVKDNIVEPSDYIKNGMFPQTDRHTIHGQMNVNK